MSYLLRLSLVLVALVAGTPAFAATKIVILRSPFGTFEPLIIAKQQGFFAKHGLDADIQIGGTPDQQVAQLLSGRAQFAMTGGVTFVSAIANRVPIIAVLNVQDTASPATTGLVVPVNSPIKTVSDLKGHSVGIGGLKGSTHLGLLVSLAAHGVDPASVRMVNLPSDTMIETAKRQGVDAIFPYGLVYPAALDSGFRLVETSTVDYLAGTPQVVMAATKSYVAQNAATVDAFNAALTEAYAFTNTHPEVVRAVDRAETKLPPDFIATYPILPFTGTFQKAPLENQADQMVKFGFIRSKPAMSDLIWSRAPAK